jgi:hypothetical protein
LLFDFAPVESLNSRPHLEFKMRRAFFGPRRNSSRTTNARGFKEKKDIKR